MRLSQSFKSETLVEWDFYDYDKENFIKLLENLFDVIPYNFEKY